MNCEVEGCIQVSQTRFSGVSFHHGNELRIPHRWGISWSPLRQSASQEGTDLVTCIMLCTFGAVLMFLV